MLLRRIRSSVLKRPLVYTLAGFLLAFFICGFFDSYFKLTLSLIALYVALILIIIKILLNVRGCKKNPRLLPVIMILLALAVAFMSSWVSFDIRFSSLKERYHEKEAEVKVIILSADTATEHFSSHEVIVTEIAGERCSIKATMTSSYHNPHVEGDTLRLPVKISVDTDFSDLSSAYDISHGRLLTLVSEDETEIEILDSESIFPYTQIAFLRSKVEKTVMRYTDGYGSALSGALLYGDRSDLSRSFTEAFRELGLSHMLAISGMHFSITVGLLAIVFSKLRINKRISVFVLALFVVLYAFLAGFSGSVCRAAIMLLLSYASFLFGRRSDAVTSLFCAAFLICLFSPYAIYDVGLLLSFFSTLGILSLALPINTAMRKMRFFRIKSVFYFASAINITLSAMLFTLPISYFCFGYVSFISPISNLIFAPFITVLLYLLPVLVIFSSIKPLALLVGGLINILSEITVNIAQKLSDSGDYCVDFEYGFSAVLLVLMIISVALILLFLKSEPLRRWLVYVPLVVFMIGCYTGNYLIVRPYIEGDSISFYSEEGNDAIILSSGGTSILCDSSNGGYNFAQNAIEYGEDMCKTEIGTYMITDYHYTHIATVTKIVEYTDIRSFILPTPQERDSEFHAAIVSFLEQSGCTVVLYTPKDDAVAFGNFILNVSIYEQKTANPSSLIIIENEKDTMPDYMYVSNMRDITETDASVLDHLRRCALSSTYAICGSHGKSDKALRDIRSYLSQEAITESFFFGPAE